MINQVKANLENNCVNIATTRFLIGVSGGVDSMVLLNLMNSLSNQLIAAHFNHQIRPEAVADEAFVKDQCNRLHIEYCAEQGDVLAYSTEQGLSIEEAARILRYQFLFRQATLHGCDAVVVAHNADDQAETVLMHLLRGSGTAGLKGMQIVDYVKSFSADIPILRPLLTITRQEIETYQKINQLEYRDDQSNWDTKYDRNRIRHELIPDLKTYNLNVISALNRLADNVSNDWQIVEQVRKQDWESCFIEKQGDVLIFSLASLNGLSQARLRNLFRYLVSILAPNVRDFGYIRMMSLVDFIAHPAEGKQYEIIDSYVAFLEQNQLMVGTKEQILYVLEKEYPQIDCDVVFIKEKQTYLELGDRWALKIELEDFQEKTWPMIRTASNTEAWFDADCLDWPVRIRTMLAGDRFAPLGMDNHQVKLSDYFINEKIPSWSRKKFPILVSSGDVVWVVGKRISEIFKIRSTTKSIVHMKLIKKEE